MDYLLSFKLFQKLYAILRMLQNFEYFLYVKEKIRQFTGLHDKTFDIFFYYFVLAYVRIFRDTDIPRCNTLQE